jgi:hypothetical protein
MKCTQCGKDLVLPSKAYLNLETYKVGGAVMVASECCNTGYIIKMEVSYKVTPYTGDATEDDWGVDLSKPKTKKIKN